jgi:hypothetical protein
MSYIIRCCFFADDEVTMIPPKTFASNTLRYELYKKAVLMSVSDSRLGVRAKPHCA